MYKLQEVLLLLSEEKILGIIKAIRENPFLDRYKGLLKSQPRLNVSLENNKLKLCSIEFSGYDEIMITPLGITFIPYYSSEQKEKLLISTGWEDLCQQLGIN